MQDIFGLPRHSETIANGGFAGASWKVFWAPPLFQTATNNISVTCPYPFPIRYFLPYNQYGQGNATTSVTTARIALYPIVRVTLINNGSIAAGTNFVISPKAASTAGTTIMTLNPGGAASTAAYGLCYITNTPTGNQTVLFGGGYVVDQGTVVTVTSPVSYTHNGSDLWFSLVHNGTGNQSMVLVEYLELPL